MEWYHLKIFLHTGKLYFGHPSVVAVLCLLFPQLKIENCIIFFSDTICIQPFFSTCTSNTTPCQNLNYVGLLWNRIQIADVAVTKRNRAQRLYEFLIFFLPALYWKPAKLFTKKLSETRAFITSVCCMKRAHFLAVYNKRMLCENDCVKFRGRIAWHSFLEINFAEFLYEVRVIIKKKFDQTLVAFRYSIVKSLPNLVHLEEKNSLCQLPTYLQLI